jgi:cell division transport system ATP-binding protein
MIKFNRVTAGYGNRIVLKDVSLHIKPSSFQFLTGPSGAGKSTLLRLMNMEFQPKQGELSVLGEDVTRLSPLDTAQLRRRIGSVWQDNPVLKHLTAWENVAVPLLVMGKKVSLFAEDVTDLLDWVGLGDCMLAHPRELSGGQLARVGIARAVVNKPEILLADEPTGNLDPQTARRMLRLFLELNRLGTTVLIATHDHQLMRQTKAPRIEIHDGSIRVV